jgi:multiple sugar transport system ATP-binding protein
MAELTLDQVRKVYPGNTKDGVEAVRSFSLSIRDGEFIVLVGPSGCGKSTVLRMIAGLEELTSGNITIGSRVVNDLHPRDRDIAMVFQNYALYPHMTCRKIMSFPLKMRSVPKAEIHARVTAVAASLGITEYLDRRPGQLSGGQRQRVALGRAIVREPKAFLFDEPLSNLDAKLRVSTRAELKALHQRLKTTSVYVTHDQEEAMTLGDRIVVMSRGVIQQSDAPLNVYRRPANRFVAGFIGTPPMNFIDGTLTDSGGALRFQSTAEPSITLTPAPEHAAHLRAHLSKPVVLGLRPSAFTLANAATSWSVQTTVVEPLGESIDLACRAGSMALTARLPADAALAPNTAIHLSPRPPEAHWFEPGEFGRSLIGP